MKQVEFEKLVDEINKCKDQLKRAEEKLRVTGLRENGSIRTEGQWVEGAYCYVAEAGKLKAKIDKATVSLRQPRNVKNKIIARLHMASAMGEAVVIMNEVLGNGLIPTVDKKELLALEAPKE